mmetsp:Transcript_31346/g.91446  ORF Transcript_31346/g.91446 Transcript_31346/m.91446 type:complete len:210 (+) Transcript_31346:74-703(+)
MLGDAALMEMGVTDASSRNGGAMSALASKATRARLEAAGGEDEARNKRLGEGPAFDAGIVRGRAWPTFHPELLWPQSQQQQQQPSSCGRGRSRLLSQRGVVAKSLSPASPRAAGSARRGITQTSAVGEWRSDEQHRQHRHVRQEQGLPEPRGCVARRRWRQQQKKPRSQDAGRMRTTGKHCGKLSSSRGQSLVNALIAPRRVRNNQTKL